MMEWCCSCIPYMVVVSPVVVVGGLWSDIAVGCQAGGVLADVEKGGWVA